MYCPFRTLLVSGTIGLLAACGSSYRATPPDADGGADARPDAGGPDAAQPDAGHLCGDGRLDPGEICDGEDLGGLTCSHLGYQTGTLRCTQGCELDPRECGSLCGNGALDPGEACDGGDLSGATCQGIGLDPGVLACGSDCSFDLSGCGGCGNGRLDPGEACDGSDLGGATCQGYLGCHPDCLLDTDGCDLPQVGDGGDGPLEVNGAMVLGAPEAGSWRVLALGPDRAQPDTPDPGLSPGDEVLLVNVQGSPDACDSAGRHELLRVAAIAGGEVIFTQPVAGIYGPGGTNDDLAGQHLVLQRVPHFSQVLVASGGSLYPPAWDGARGGILAMRVAGELVIEAGGRLHATGRGFRGGAGWSGSEKRSGRQGESLCGNPQAVSVSPNDGGGGGGRYQDTSDDCGQGGGGAGHAGPGTWEPFGQTCREHGADNPADNAGQPYGTPDLTDLLLGSGGGAGATDNHSDSSGSGGRGGGLIWIAAATVRVEGSIASNGRNGFVADDPTDSGNGGGGSGGSIILRAGRIEGTGRIGASGGLGPAAVDQWNNPGGDGAPGRIRIDFRRAGGFHHGSAGAADWLRIHCAPSPGRTDILLD